MTDSVPRHVHAIGDDFWNIRGSFRFGILDVGTQTSLVRLATGRFVLLDAYSLDREKRAFVDALTAGGQLVEAIINLHPFHTVHVESTHREFPHAKLYGTARHHAKFPKLPWQRETTESAKFHRLFEPDFDFTVPRGVEFIPENENLHFSSVLAIHRASKTMHVDDTLMHVKMPPVLRYFVPEITRFHPTLKQTLERRAGAARDFRVWTLELVEKAKDVENLCTAHTASLLESHNPGASLSNRIADCLENVEPTLRAHERKYG